MNRALLPLRLLLAALAAVLGFWLISQLTVATWLAGDALQREADWEQGVSPWQWDFSRASSIVQPGSHGIGTAHRSGAGLSLRLPDDGVASLLLALDGGHVALDAVQHARIELDASAPVRLLLLPAWPGQHLSWMQTEVAAGIHRLDLPLTTLPTTTSPALQLRIESTPGATVQLRQLTLLAAACETSLPCPIPRREQAATFATPEQLLAFRDVSSRQAPAVAIEAGGAFGQIGRWFAARLHGASDPLLRLLAPSLLAVVLIALLRHLRRRTRNASAKQAALELAIPLGGAFVLLLAGWPARDTPMQAGVTLLLCLAALALLPPPSRNWHWHGDASAWKSALTFTALAALVIAPLAWLERDATAIRDALHFLRYPLWSLVQQWLLIAAIAPRVRVLLPGLPAASFACGLLFALMHAPNFALMTATFVGGSAWAWLGYRHRALLPLAASHAVLGLWLVHVAPTWILRSAEIGGRYLMPP